MVISTFTPSRPLSNGSVRKVPKYDLKEVPDQPTYFMEVTGL